MKAVPAPSTTLGSSPRVRGSLKKKVLELCDTRIIPAGAGLTCQEPPLPMHCRDHPRGCGAHVEAEKTRLVTEGSSPRVRGSRSCKSPRAIYDGIIPAGAGLTSGDGVDANPAEDHPRGCGAHLPAPVSNVLGAGSSPRVRGSQCFLRIYERERRIIPAGAGLTLTSASHC